MNGYELGRFKSKKGLSSHALLDVLVHRAAPIHMRQYLYSSTRKQVN